MYFILYFIFQFNFFCFKIVCDNGKENNVTEFKGFPSITFFLDISFALSL